MARVPLKRLLRELKGEREFPVELTNAGCEPGNEPITRREEQRLLKTVIGPFFFPREQHVAASQPHIRRVAPLFDGCIRERQRSLQVPAPAQSHSFGREQLRL